MGSVGVCLNYVSAHYGPRGRLAEQLCVCPLYAVLNYMCPAVFRFDMSRTMCQSNYVPAYYVRCGTMWHIVSPYSYYVALIYYMLYYMAHSSPVLFLVVKRVARSASKQRLLRAAMAASSD